MVQVRAYQVEDVVEPALHAMDLLADVAAGRQVEALAEEFQEPVQRSSALQQLGHERDRQVELRWR